MVSDENPMLVGPCVGRPGVQPDYAGPALASQRKSWLIPDLRQLKNSEDENHDNFCVRTPILVNLGFLKS
jgi:hypothetical protein